MCSNFAKDLEMSLMYLKNLMFFGIFAKGFNLALFYEGLFQNNLTLSTEIR
jgi:hypothetical protein